MSGSERVHSPCSKGCPLTAVAFILRASLADVSQCEPLLVSWSLSAWSLSPWPLSRRLARSASLNVELQQNWGRTKKTHTQLAITSVCLLLSDSRSQLAWYKDENHQVHRSGRKVSDGALTFAQMAACCRHNWTPMGNSPSRKKRKRLFCIDQVSELKAAALNNITKQISMFSHSYIFIASTEDAKHLSAIRAR